MPTFHGPCTYADAAADHIMLTISFEPAEPAEGLVLDEPFQASKDAPGPAGEAYRLAASGALGDIGPYVAPQSSSPPAPSAAQLETLLSQAMPPDQLTAFLAAAAKVEI